MKIVVSLHNSPDIHFSEAALRRLERVISDSLEPDSNWTQGSNTLTNRPKNPPRRPML